ncbi:MAG: TIM barrel protein [Dehalococcoidia bacterium]
MTSVSGAHRVKESKLFEVSLSTMWAKGRFGHMAAFAAKALELGFTHVEANSSVSPEMLRGLIETAVPISSIHCPCPTALSSRGIPVSSRSLSALDESERTEAISFAKHTIDLASSLSATAIVLHMGEVPIDLSLQDKLYKLCAESQGQTEEYSQAKEELLDQRISRVAPYLDAARESLRELGEYARQKGIMLGLETRFHFHEIPNIDEMAELLNEVPGPSVGYWHDVGHAEVQERLGFSLHEEWLSRFEHRMIGIHLHAVLGISDHQAPGQGEMNWAMVAKYLPPGIIKVCEIGPWNDEEQVQGVVNHLRKQRIVG